MIFLRHLELDISAYLVMLEDFGIASGLHVNLNKCAALPIRHQQEHLQLISTISVVRKKHFLALT